MFDLAIIIVSYKTRDLLDKCVESILAGKYPFTYRIVAVDNASGDGTPMMLVAKYPDVLIIANEKNEGFSIANNKGIRAVDASHVLLLNPDTEVAPETLTAMFQFMDRHPHVGIVGCQLLNTDGSLQTSWFNFPVPLGRKLEGMKNYAKIAQKALKLPPAQPEIQEPGVTRVDVVKGACLLIRKETVNQIGLLDENSFLYADDIDWCIRARRKGWEAYALTDHTITHHGYASTDQEPYITITSSRRSALYLYRKHYSGMVSALWSVLIYQEIFYKLLLNRIRFTTRPNDEKVKSRYLAYRDLAFGDKNKK